MLFFTSLFLLFATRNPFALDLFEDGCDKEETQCDLKGTLYGHVYNWADSIQNYIQLLAHAGIKKSDTQALFDKANYTYEEKNGTKAIATLQKMLSLYLQGRKEAAMSIAAAAIRAYDESILQQRRLIVQHLKHLDKSIYMDADDPKSLDKRVSSSYFKQPIIANRSTVKIADEVPRDLNHTINSVNWTYRLEEVMRKNALSVNHLRWQYFGSKTGVLRSYPGREWSSNFVGFYEDYDPRTRPWYISATSGPKDVVIVLDCSSSMKNFKFGIAKEVANTIIKTLTKRDYMNVVCARESQWDDVGKWHPYKSEVLSCQDNRLVPATSAFRKDLIGKIDELQAGGTTELHNGFEMAFKLLDSKPRTSCHSIIVFVTDGKDTDGDAVRCGPGYYTRSGYVPGPVCK